MLYVRRNAHVLLLFLIRAATASAETGYGMGGAAGGATETGLGPDHFYSVVLHGDYVVAGASTRVRSGAQQVEPFVLMVKGIPCERNAVVKKVFANWSYLTVGHPAEPGHEGLAEIKINDVSVSAEYTAVATSDLCWGDPPEWDPDHTVAYHADVTGIFDDTAWAWGNGHYVIEGAVDEGDHIGEGISILVVYEADGEPRASAH